MTSDYSITLKDSVGRVVTLSINGASIDELLALGSSSADAQEGLEATAFGNAIDRGEIGSDAWLVSRAA